jgi:hypothetical protein
MDMKIRIVWTLFLNVSSPAKASKVVHKISKLIELTLSVTHGERYWKEKTLFKVTAHAEMEATSPGDAFFKVMQLASRLAGSWTIAGPHGDHGTWEFGGTASPGTLRIPGADSVVFNATITAEAEVNSEHYSPEGSVEYV